MIGEIAITDMAEKLEKGTGYRIGDSDDPASYRYKQTWVVFGEHNIEIHQSRGYTGKDGTGDCFDEEWYCKLPRPDFNRVMSKLDNNGSIELGGMDITEIRTPRADGIPQEREYSADLTIRLIHVGDKAIFELEKNELKSPVETRNAGCS